MPNRPNEPFDEARRLLLRRQTRTREFVLSGYPSRSENYVQNRKVFAEIPVVMSGLGGMMYSVELRVVEDEH